MTEAVRPSNLDPKIASRLKRDANGLVPAVAQQYDTGEVLMVGWMDDEALHRTLTTGRCTYWSRSRQEYWVKGDTSGHQQWVKSVALDCDGDTVLVKVDQVGAACHTGDRTCFDADVLDSVTGERPEPAARHERTSSRQAGQARREYGFALLAGAVGAGLVLLAVRQRWAQAVFTPPKPLSPQVVNVSGTDLVPLAGALALAALAGLAAVIATRGVLRRAAGVLLALFGAGAGAAIMTSVTAATVVSVAASKVASPESAAVSGAAGSTTSGSSGGGALVVSGSTGARDHDRHALARRGAHRRAAGLRRGPGHGAARPGLAGDVRQVRRPGQRGRGRRRRTAAAAGGRAGGKAGRRRGDDVGVAERRRGPDRGRPADAPPPER